MSDRSEFDEWSPDQQQRFLARAEEREAAHSARRAREAERLAKVMARAKKVREEDLERAMASLGADPEEREGAAGLRVEPLVYGGPPPVSPSDVDRDESVSLAANALNELLSATDFVEQVVRIVVEDLRPVLGPAPMEETEPPQREIPDCSSLVRAILITTNRLKAVSHELAAMRMRLEV